MSMSDRTVDKYEDSSKEEEKLIMICGWCDSKHVDYFPLDGGFQSKNIFPSPIFQ